MDGKHLQAFQYLIGKEMRKQPVGKQMIKMGGNYRVIQDIKKQNPVILEDVVNVDHDSVMDTNNVLKIILIFVCVNIIIELGLNYAIMLRKKESIEEKQQKAL